MERPRMSLRPLLSSSPPPVCSVRAPAWAPPRSPRAAAPASSAPVFSRAESSIRPACRSPAPASPPRRRGADGPAGAVTPSRTPRGGSPSSSPPAGYAVRVEVEGFAETVQHVTFAAGRPPLPSTSSCRRGSTSRSPCGAQNGYQAPAISSGTKTPTPLRDVPQSVTVVTRQLMQDQLMTSIGDVVRYVPGVTAPPGGEQPRPGDHPRQQLVGGLLRRRRARRRPVLPRPVQPRSRRGAEGAERDDLRPRRRRRRDQPRDQGGRLRAAAGGRPAGRLLRQQARHRGSRPAARRQGRAPPERPLRELRQLPRLRRPRALRHRADPHLHASARRPRSRSATSTSATTRVGRPRHHVVPGPAGRRRHRHLLRQSRRQPRAGARQPGLRRRRASRRRAAPSATARSSATTTAAIRTSCRARSRRTESQVALTAYNNATQRQNLFNQTDLTYRPGDRSDPAHAAGRRRGRPAAHRQLPQHRLLQQHRDVDPGAVRQPDDRHAGDLPAERDRRRQSPAHQRRRRSTRRIRSSSPASCSWSPGCASTASTCSYHNNRNGDELGRVDDLVSPRAGVVVKPVAALSLYGSYSVSYLPSSGDQFSSLTTITQQVKPEKFNNYEVGAKWDAADSLSLTTAVYRLDRTNTRSTDPNDPTRIVQTGSQRTNGLRDRDQRPAHAGLEHRRRLRLSGRLRDQRDHRGPRRAPRGPGAAPHAVALEQLPVPPEDRRRRSGSSTARRCSPPSTTR